jgi:hypothetical protein
MLADEIKVYQDDIGQVHGQPRHSGQLPNDGISQNGQLYVALTHLLLKIRGELTPEFHPQWVNMMNACKLREGIYLRHNAAHMDNWQSPDNFIGIACSSAVFNDPTFCKDIVEYGQKNSGYKLKDLIAELPVTTTNKILSVLLGWMPLHYVYKWEPDHTLHQCWLGRQLGLIAVMKWGAGMRPSFIEKIVHCISLLLSISQVQKNRRNVDPANLGWMCVNVANGKSWWCDIIGRYFIKRMKEIYSDVNFGDYYNPGNENHPNAKYFKWE